LVLGENPKFLGAITTTGGCLFFSSGQQRRTHEVVAYPRGL
jgi:hypothetical protein